MQSAQSKQQASTEDLQAQAEARLKKQQANVAKFEARALSQEAKAARQKREENLQAKKVIETYEAGEAMPEAANVRAQALIEEVEQQIENAERMPGFMDFREAFMAYRTDHTPENKKQMLDAGSNAWQAVESLKRNMKRAHDAVRDETIRGSLVYAATRLQRKREALLLKPLRGMQELMQE